VKRLKARISKSHGTKKVKLQKKLEQMNPEQILLLGRSIQVMKTIGSSEEGDDSGPKLKYRLLVAGHWKNQVCGPQRSERKRIFIEPYWKGPGEAIEVNKDHSIELGEMK